MDKLKAKKEERVEKQDKLEALVKVAQSGDLSKEQKEQFDTLEKEIGELDADIKRLERIETIEKEKAKSQTERTFAAPADNSGEEKELEKIAKKFSIGRAFQLVNKNKTIDGVEKEVYDIAKAEASEAGAELTGNIAIPQKFIKIGNRKALDVATEGADVVFTEYGGKIIPYLNPQPVADRLGVTMLQGLRGNVQWPRESGDLSFAFETESSDVNETTPTFDNISITPKRFGGYVDVTQQMLKQSVEMLDGWMRNKLNLRYAITVDDAIFNGTGASNQPTGLFYFSSVNILSLGSSGGDMTYNALVSMIRDTKSANARMGREGFVTNAAGEYALGTTPKQTSGTEGNFILDYARPGQILGRPFYTSEIIKDDFSEGAQSDLVGIAYSSNWGGLIAGFWGGLDILFDPYTQALGGKVRFVCNAFMDVDIEQPLEFAICKDRDATDAPALT